jgi:uncharacterized protein (TIGR02246 family)
MRSFALSFILTLIALSPSAYAEDASTACTALVLDYAHHRDNFNAESFANLFTEDGILIIGEDRWEGRAAIQARIDALDSSATIRHYMSSIRISPIDADHATGVSYVVIYRTPQGSTEITGPALIGDYIDRYIRTEDGWKIAHRELLTTFNQR